MLKKEKDIALGHGAYYIGDTILGLTRGGGKFTVEREYRNIEADGDRGGVVGRVELGKSIPKLQTNLLQIISENLPQIYPAMRHTAAGQSTKMQGTGTISESDYLDTVKWVGKTKKGKAIVIEVSNALNLENIDWTMQDESEIVPVVTFTGHYPEGWELLPDAERVEPWGVTYPISTEEAK